MPDSLLSERERSTTASEGSMTPPDSGKRSPVALMVEEEEEEGNRNTSTSPTPPTKSAERVCFRGRVDKTLTYPAADRDAAAITAMSACIAATAWYCGVQSGSPAWAGRSMKRPHSGMPSTLTPEPSPSACDHRDTALEGERHHPPQSLFLGGAVRPTFSPLLPRGVNRRERSLEAHTPDQSSFWGRVPSKPEDHKVLKKRPLWTYLPNTHPKRSRKSQTPLQ